MGTWKKQITWSVLKVCWIVVKDNCIMFNKCIYSLVQAAWQSYKKAVKILKKLGFMGGIVNQCIYVKMIEKVLVFIVLFIDNNLVLADVEVIVAGAKIMEKLQDYLSCEVKF